MFSNFLYLFAALLLFSTYSPDNEYVFSAVDILFLGLNLFIFSRLCISRFKVLDIAMENSIFTLKTQTKYHDISTFLMTLSVVFYFVAIYFLHLKEIIFQVTGFPKDFFLNDVLGLAFFFCYFYSFWNNSFPYHARLFNSTIDRDEYVKSQFKFNVPILVPWFCISLLFYFMEETLISFNITINQNLKDFIVLPLFFLTVAIFMPLIIKRMWGCESGSGSETVQELETFCRSKGLKFKAILIWNVFEGKLFTAGIMGLVARFRYILITPVMLNSLTMEELKSVLAHEIGHNKNHHMNFLLFFFLGFILISINYPNFLFLFIQYSSILDIDWFLHLFEENSTYFSLFWVTVPIVLLLIIYFRLFFGIFSRAFEREADIHSLQLMGSADGIVSSLEKIGFYSGDIRDMPNWH
ncbi:MAG: M48 family metalloprotease, partial [Nitrospinae bacterium]|nr:M48 family metalloprotease [Nitrospinota bacterium]